MAGHSRQLQSTQVDGIPAFYVESGQTLRATLSFRTGVVDETLSTRGWTHLIEHLAMHGIQADETTSNASVGPLSTEFTVAGEPDEVVAFFDQLCERVREPSFEHVEHERKILLAEGARRSRGEFENHVSFRFGARGFGLLAYDELGLHQISEEGLYYRITRSFVTGNAALALNGPPPPGLRLDLPDGPRLPLPTSRHLDPLPPYHFQALSEVAASSALCRGTFEATVAAELLARRIRTRLRDERGQSYATEGVVERADATSLMVLVESDVTEEGWEEAVDVMRNEYTALATSGPSSDEVNLIRRHHLRALDDDLTGEWQATASVGAHLRGDQPLRQDDLRSFLRTMSSETLMPTMAQLADSFVASSPAGLTTRTTLPFERGLPDLPAPVGGQTFTAALAPLDPARLVISDRLLEVADPLGNVRRTDLHDCVALVKFADGGRVIWSGHGDALPLEPTDWREGTLAVCAVDQAVDRGSHIELPERSGDARPAVPRFTLQQRLVVFAEKPAGYAAAAASSMALLALLAALLFGTDLLPGDGPVGFVVFILLWSSFMTWLRKGRRDASSTAPPAPAPGASQQDPAATGSSRADRSVLLISRSCTTSWLDWVHGELWMAPDALVRLRLSLGQSARHGPGPTVALPERADPDDPQFAPDVVRAGNRRNKYIRFDDIASARLRRGILNGRLSITTHSGERHKFLWLGSDPAFMILMAELPHRIPRRLTVE